MPFEPERHADDLVMFGVPGLQRERSVQAMGGLVRTRDGVPESTLMSVRTTFMDAHGRRLSVSSHRRDDDHFELRRRHVPAGTYLAMLRPDPERSRIPPDRGALRAEDLPELRWTTIVIRVDGRETPFELCRFDHGFWAAIGRVERAEITLESHGVDLEGLELQTLHESPPRMPPRPVPPPAPHLRFPEELFEASPPVSIPISSRVDVLHRGRFSGDGTLRGVVAGADVDLALELPRSQSSASGRLGAMDVRVTWRLTYGSGPAPELSATLDGSLGGRQIRLRGAFRLGPGHSFERASVEGTLAGTDLAASLERAAGGFGGSSTVAATGAVADRRFSIFAAVDPTLDRGVLRGSYGPQVIHLDARRADPGATRVSGACASPPEFALLLIGSLLFFV